MSAAVENNQNSVVLPSMRDDLQLVAGAEDAGGWLIIDPLKQAYYRISSTVFEVLSVWKSGTAEALIARFVQRYGRSVDHDQVVEVTNFLTTNELTVEPQEGGWRNFAGLSEKRKKSWLSQSFHSYLFFRIPLFHPQKFLDYTWPYVSWMYTRSFVFLIGILGLLSLWLVSRQWDVFTTTFSSFLTLEGAITYGGVLVFVKIVHEFGHAYMARKYNAPVSTFGAAFIVLFPILYTDTTSAWLLDRRKRLMIDAGGIFAELVLAVIATTLWVFLPDGNMRALCFVVATISWILSLAVNLNPLMRFDGYYILSDGFGVENLQARGFSLARWRMREALFGLGENPPETMSPMLQRGLVLHAYATWIYRFFLFLGIALIVYYMFFKLAGIVLFAVEIVWFIGLPIYRELKEWGKRRQALRFNFQTMRTLLITCILGGGFFLPWQRSISAPAVYSAGEIVNLFPLGSGQLTALNLSEGMRVEKGDVLAVITDVALEAQIVRVKEQVKLLELRLARITADTQDRSQLTVLESELSSRKEQLLSLNEQIDDLTLRASASGIVSNVMQDLDVGYYVSGATKIAIITTDDTGEVTAFVPSEKVDRIELEAITNFIPQEPELAKLEMVVTDIAPPTENDVRIRQLLDVYGGPIVAHQDPKTGNSIAREPHYQVRFSTSNKLPVPLYEMRGTVHINAKPQSFANRVLRRVAGVLIRESGF